MRRSMATLARRVAGRAQPRQSGSSGGSSERQGDAHLGAYVRSLVQLGGAAQPQAQMQAGAFPGAGAGGAPLGSASSPLYTAQLDPGWRTQLWRTVRALGTAFIVFSGVGALLEDRGLGRSLLGSSSEVKAASDTSTRFDDVKGVDEAKSELEELVEYLKDPERFTRLGGKLPHGVLLVGPPGTGKTMLARAVAGEAGVPFYYTSGSEFEEMFVGVGARRVRELFETAKKNAPCIVFIDEIDAIGGSRNPRDQTYMKQTLNELLSNMDGFKPNEGVIVLAATNMPESLDKALLRPGRFDRQSTIPNPDVKGRQQILEANFKRVKADNSVRLEEIARGTPGFSGADLSNLVNIAALKAAREDRSAISNRELEYAKDRILMGAERKSAYVPEENRRLTATHEGGHALVALKTEGASPLHKATIIPRGSALGVTMQLPEKDETSATRKQLLAKLDVAMAGRVAEELVYGDQEVTTGASSDFNFATKLARDMVTKHGFNERVGYVSQEYEANGLSSETRRAIEEEVKAMLDASHKRAKNLLQRNRDALDALASNLMTHETLSGEQIKQVVTDGRVSDDASPTAPATAAA